MSRYAHPSVIRQLEQPLQQIVRVVLDDPAEQLAAFIGCGPAREIQEFLAEEEVSDFAHFTLLDFNDETLRHAAQVLEDARRSHARRTAIVLQRKSVQHVLREGYRRAPTDSRNGYDLIYCAGLFDYLSDRVCRQLMTIFYEWLSPGGLLADTIVDDRRPFRHMLEFVLVIGT